MNLYKKRTVGALPFFFYAFLAIPLIYLPNLVNTSRSLRYIALFAIPAMALSIYSLRQRSVARFAKSQPTKKILVGAIVALMLLTGIVLAIQHNLAFLGTAPDYLGLLSWLAFFMAAILFQNDVRKLIFGRLSLYILGVAMAVSLLYSRFYIQVGIRIPGVMFQPTTLAMYANIAAIVALYHTRKKVAWKQKIVPWFVFLLSVTLIGLCQSRIGNIMLTITLIVWAYNAVQEKNIKFSALLIALATVVIAVPLIFTSYFSRFRSESVDSGISYRLDLYKTSAKDIAKHNIIKGNGPGSLPPAINNPNGVPEDIAKTLHLGFRFNSTHDLFFDFTYYFGLIGGLMLVIFVVWSIVQYAKAKYEYGFAYFLIFIALLINALFNVPSLELTSLFFVVLFGLTGVVIAEKSKKQSNK